MEDQELKQRGPTHTSTGSMDVKLQGPRSLFNIPNMFNPSCKFIMLMLHHYFFFGFSNKLKYVSPFTEKSLLEALL